jgi:hypothetical protein
MYHYDDVFRTRMPTRLLERLFDWLSPSDPVCSSDLIFALAGRHSRKLFALELFRQGRATCLLLSVGRYEIRKFAQLPWPGDVDLARVATSTQAVKRHYFVSFEAGSTGVELVHRGQFGTLSEIRALARWLEPRPHIQSLVVVSSAPHLRRVRACCRGLLPPRLQLHFLPTPNDGWLNRSSWWRNRHSRVMVVKEVGKLFLYWFLLMAAASEQS